MSHTESEDPMRPIGAVGNDEDTQESSKNVPDPSAASGEALDPLAKALAEVDRLKDMWMRTAADFDNFRKRSRREIDDSRKAGKEDLLRAVLPVFDNLERAIQSAQKASDVKAVADGLAMVIRQFGEALSKQGIQKVPAVGVQFDPTVHEAIQQMETDDQPPGTIIAEVQPGYVQEDRLIRAAMVVVSKAKSQGSSTN